MYEWKLHRHRGTPVTERSLTGTLQAELMRVLWDGGPATVEEVRTRLPEAHRGAYTTVQTVLNRLAERGLLGRERRGKSLRYSPLISEAEHVSSSLRRTLDSASSAAKAAALAEIIGSLEGAELRELQQQASAIERLRRV
jgi:predicted transcriptional regulator